MLLEIKDLKVHYGKAEALKGISMGIEEGTIVTLIGANGAGKTTTLRTISGAKAPTSGKIWFQGERIDDLPPHEIARRGIAHVPEGRRVLATMTVLENLEMGAYLRKDKSGIARDLENIYEHFPVLKERRRQMAGSLSGGEQQMLATARAMMAGPKLLLMDEPSMGLSPVLVEEVGKMITNINQTGVTIMLVEQNARIALRLADRAYVLEVGNIVLAGEAKELINDEHVKKAYLGG
ncbi:High-affinity branched-chain amino acid transport ATP-binding protein LivF [subsurface metagenome]